ncbi:NAD(P)-dependent oxidoreductase [Streptomyces sp. NPDC006627]|uniref:NAD-dependent epimerase/dehydratase family protein n=1 Tax=Streptomyces sp. NPDC006627 TaxID=3154679 RepID=UPI0033BC4743
MTGRSVLVTGATGFVGRHLTARLCERGDRVTVLLRSASRHRCPDLPGLRTVVGDLATGEGVQEAVKDSDCVVHLAAVLSARSARAYRRGNTEGTQRLLDALAGLPDPPRLVLCSSLAAAGPSHHGQPRTEEDTPQPVSHYGRSKLAAEEAARVYADRVSTVVVRPPIVYGPGDRALLPSLLPMVRAGIVLKSGYGPRSYSLLHVADLCSALVAACERGKTLSRDDPAAGVYFVSDGREYSWENLCCCMASVLGRRPPTFLPVPLPVVWVTAAMAETAGRLRTTPPPLTRDKVREMRHPAWTCSTERARADLHFVPRTDLTEGLARWAELDGPPIR